MRFFDVENSLDYYSFGMLMPERFGGGDYRYGFGNFEKDDEIAGEGNSYTAEFWQYDSRLGRRWNIDPVVKHDQSGYSAFANNPIWFSDAEGRDTLMMHRTAGKIQKDGRFMLYVVTFSIIRNGVETSIPLTFKQVALYKPNGINIVRPKDNNVYELKFAQMGRHQNWKNTIRVKGVLGENGEAAIFMHPVSWGCYFPSYTGCIGSSERFDENGAPVVPSDYKVSESERFKYDEEQNREMEYTESLLKKVKELYVYYGIGNKNGDNYSGNDFLLKGNSKVLVMFDKIKPLKAQPIILKTINELVIPEN